MTIAKQKARNFLRNIQNDTKGDMQFPAFMGNRSGVVKADKKNNVFVVDYRGVVHKVKNIAGVPNVAKLPVLVGRDKSNPKFLQVLRMRDAYIDPPYPSVAEHAEIMHSRWGYDPVFIISGQILPGLATPSRTLPMTMQLRGFPYYLDGWHLLDNTDIDFSGEIPTSGANWVVAEIDNAKVITLRAGDSVTSRSELRPEDIPTVASDKKSLFAVKCYFGQTRIINTRIDTDYFDMRFTGIASGGIATSVAWDDVTGKPTSYSSAIITTAVSDKSTSYTLVAGDKNTYIRSTGSAITITVPNVLADGESVNFIQAGAGQITFAGSGVTISSADAMLKTGKQFAGATVTKLGGVYYLVGNLGA